MKKRYWIEWFWGNIFYLLVMVTEDILGKGRTIIPSRPIVKEIGTKQEVKYEDIEVIDLPVWTNGTTVRWLQDEHEDKEQVCIMCEKCGWVSSPITLFRDYYSYKWFRISLPERARAFLSSGWHVVSLSRNVQSFCPHCMESLAVVLDLRREERLPK
jgi:hypothetical protein